MEKLVYVLWKRPDGSEEQLKEALLGTTGRRLLELGARGLVVNVVDEDVGHAKDARITHLDPPIAGMVSFWLDLADARGPHEQELAAVTERYAGYLVLESVPLVNTMQRAPAGRRTPGVNMVACIERPQRLTPEQWRAHWFGHHREVALETQSIFGYVRNEVVRPLTPEAPAWAGIVEESFPADAVTDPMLWYAADGSEEKMQRNIERMMESVQAFLDIDRVESNPMSEYRMTP